jgi:hypothetical protein
MTVLTVSTKNGGHVFLTVHMKFDGQEGPDRQDIGQKA